MAARAVKKPGFEEGLARLEALAERMESGDLPLDALLKAYEEGVKLSKELSKRLDEAQGRMRSVAPGADGAPQVQDVILKGEEEA